MLGAKILGIGPSLFVLKERKFPSPELKFLEHSLLRSNSSTGAKVLGTFALEERKLHMSESSKEGMFQGTKVPSVDFSLPGTKVQRNEKSVNR